ncbi:MAG: cupin domain-containing protein [Chloroflexi bacterium]|nr:cupin domain-containing protein [Chloroflexota bacterium]
MEPQVFRYEVPSNDRSKNLTMLCRTDRLAADMQLVKEGGENRLHSHTSSDGFFLVLEGRVRFYSEGDVVLAELGKDEGILIPHGFRYWFASSGEEPLRILHVGASDPNTGDVRVGPSRAESAE